MLDEARHRALVAKFSAAQRAFQRSQQECTHLHLVVRAKQEVIEELLPYYPHPLSPTMQAKIYLS